MCCEGGSKGELFETVTGVVLNTVYDLNDGNSVRSVRSLGSGKTKTQRARKRALCFLVVVCAGALCSCPGCGCTRVIGETTSDRHTADSAYVS